MKNLFKIRFIQIARFFKKIGWPYSLLILFIAIILFYKFFELKSLLISNIIYGTSIEFILCTGIFFLHRNRNDKIFVISRFKYYKLLFFIEYFLISIPFIILFSISIFYIGTFFFLFFSALLVNKDSYYIKNFFNIKSIDTYITFWLDEKYYEWLSGIRKYWFGILFLYIIAIALIPFNHFSIIFIWIIIVAIIPSFYIYFEPLIFIESQKLSASVFLLRKISRHFFLSFVLIAPFLLIYIFFHPGQYIFFVISLFISLIVITWLNYFKYYAYKHVEKVPIFYKYVVTSGSFLIFFFLPLFLFGMIYKWKKLKSNIEFYINA